LDSKDEAKSGKTYVFPIPGFEFSLWIGQVGSEAR